jgi:hypothetical protein
METAMRVIAGFFLMFVMAGCATQAERAAAVQRDVDDMMRVYGPGCEKLGYRADSDPWRECVLRLATNDRRDRRDFTTTNCFRTGGFLNCSTF